jgi:hypothetical protein
MNTSSQHKQHHFVIHLTTFGQQHITNVIVAQHNFYSFLGTRVLCVNDFFVMKYKLRPKDTKRRQNVL